MKKLKLVKLNFKKSLFKKIKLIMLKIKIINHKKIFQILEKKILRIRIVKVSKIIDNIIFIFDLKIFKFIWNEKLFYNYKYPFYY